MEIFALEGNLSSEIGRMKTDNVTVTNFFDDYVHVHNTQTSLISQRIMKEDASFIILCEIMNPLHNSVNINRQIFVFMIISERL